MVMALSGTAAAPAFGGHGCHGGNHGCSGYYSCSGYGHGGYGCSGYGCSGSCHGGHGFFNKGHGCHGGHGCSGYCSGYVSYGCSGYGCSGSCHGGHGLFNKHGHGGHGCSGYSNCCGYVNYSCCGCTGGNVYYGGMGGMPMGAPMGAPMGGPQMQKAPAPTPGGAATPVEPRRTDTKPPAALNAAPAKVLVSLPVDASLTIDGQSTTSTGTSREFVSPALESGKDYVYTLTVNVVREGKTVSESKTVLVRAGETSTISFGLATVAAN